MSVNIETGEESDRPALGGRRHSEEVAGMPRITQQQKKLNRERIVSAAGEGFKLYGVDGIGIQDVMKAAGMTNGGFYNHFESKEDLALEVYRQGFADSLGALAGIREAHPRSAEDALHRMVDAYVVASHRDHPETGCPSAALPVDAGRHGARAQTEYRNGLEGYLSSITDMIRDRDREGGTGRSEAEAREEAVAVFSQMVGSVILDATRKQLTQR
jgi:TetR/AcrR family transcriptional repressor of nem operon